MDEAEELAPARVAANLVLALLFGGVAYWGLRDAPALRTIGLWSAGIFAAVDVLILGIYGVCELAERWRSARRKD